MLQQNIQAPPLSEGASTISRLGRAIELLRDPDALQARIDEYRAARQNSTDTDSQNSHAVRIDRTLGYFRGKHACFPTVTNTV